MRLSLRGCKVPPMGKMSRPSCLLIVLALAFSSCGGGTTATTTQQSKTTTTARAVADEEPSIAFKLAAVDTGDSSPSDETVAAYQAALDAVDGICNADPNTTHADYALTTIELAAEPGVSVDALEVLQGIAIADVGRELDIDCAVLYATVVLFLTEDS